MERSFPKGTWPRVVQIGVYVIMCECFPCLQALSVSDLSMVLFVCRMVDSKQLFSTTPCPLAQAVLLSLIQQLSADLGMSTDLKLE